MTRSLRYSLALAITLAAGVSACDTAEPASDDLPLKTERGSRGKADGGVAPAAWDCNASYYDTNDGCDCGCGVIDPDCDSGSVAACGFEWCDSGDPAPTNNWQCEDDAPSAGGGTPTTWTCNPNYYDTNDGCDCGCGAVDPDCASSSASSCRYEHCDSDEQVVAANNALCSSSGGGGAGTGDDGAGDDDGGSTSPECDSTLDCEAGYTCRFDYAGDPVHGAERLCRWDGLFNPAVC